MSAEMNLVRQNQRMNRLNAQPCRCGHPMGNHRELQPEFLELIDELPVMKVNPDYRPLHFHCKECECVRDERR